MPDGKGKRTAGLADLGGRHGDGLQRVNAQLRELVSSLRDESRRLAGVRSAAAAAAEAPPSGDPGALERQRVAAELEAARAAAAEAGAERERLRDQLAEIEAEHRRVCDEYAEVEERSTEISQLYVALERLHGGETRADVLCGLQEIVINMVGSEELAVWEVRGDRLVLEHAFGVDPGPIREIPVGQGAIGRAAASGAIHVAGRGDASDADPDLTACIPLRAGGRITGAVGIYRILGHKAGLTPADHALFDLLAAHAGLALHLRAAAQAAPAAG